MKKNTNNNTKTETGTSKKTGTTVRVREIVSNLYDKEGKELISLDNIRKVLNERDCIKYYALIVHDKDTYTETDETHKAGDLKAPHVHILMKFTVPQQVDCIPKWFSLAENFSQKVLNWKSALKYLIHLDDPEKYQYQVEEVTANFDYGAFIKAVSQEKNLDLILERILSGDIREYNKTEEIDNMLLVCKSVKIEQAFKVRQERLELTAEGRDTECIFITGPSQCGKTTLAKKIAREKGLKYFCSSASNDPLYGYKQQPAVILDELRPNWMGFSDLLKMLDNHTASTAKARYRNVYLQCELIIITSILDIDDFCKNAFDDKEEPAIQLKRRCGTYIRMNKERIYVSQWDPKEMRYTLPVEYFNNLLDEYIPQDELTKEAVEEHISEMMPFLQRAEGSQRKDGFVECEKEDAPFEQESFSLEEEKEGEEHAD